MFKNFKSSLKINNYYNIINPIHLLLDKINVQNKLE